MIPYGVYYYDSESEIPSGIREIIKEQGCFYGALVKDIYFLGVVLGRKYKLLRLADNIFMVGIIIAVLAVAWQ